MKRNIAVLIAASFSYYHQNVLGSNQIAIWIKDQQGNYIDTIVPVLLLFPKG